MIHRLRLRWAPRLEVLEGRVLLDAAATGQWGPVEDWPITPITVSLLPSGKVLIWDDHADERAVWDPATDTLTTPASPDWNVFCAGQTLVSDGRIFVAGGHVASHVGVANAGIYDPVADAWVSVPAMNGDRWYPTATALSGGDVLVTAGEVDGSGDEDEIAQVYQAASNTWRDLTGAPRALPTYPWMFVAPGGKVFYAGPDADTGFLDTTGVGSWTPVARTIGGDRAAYPDGPGPQSAGSAVMYAPGKVLIVGGGRDPVATAETIDLGAARPAWQATGAMRYARQNGTATILADGTVLETGGTSGPGWNNMRPGSPVFAAEIWDPATGRWATMASEVVPRWYHSTALLLPSGQVLSAGGWDPLSGNWGGITNGEVYSPPYLFKGPRPTISAAPERMAYGQTFAVQTPDAADVAKVNFIRLGSDTHAFNGSQRNVPLAFTRAPGGLSVTAPASGDIAPPGDYMLFLVNSNGVPSVAKIIRIAPIPAAPTLAVQATSGVRVDLSWTAVSGALGYELQGRLVGTAEWGQADFGPGVTTYQNIGLTPGSTYEYRVRAITAVGNTTYSAVVTTTTIPAAPTLTARAASGSRIDLSWTVVPGAVGYELQGRFVGATEWGWAVLGGATTTFGNTGLTPGATYEYRIRAMTARGATAYSATATATTTAPIAGRKATGATVADGPVATALAAARAEEEWERDLVVSALASALLAE